MSAPRIDHANEVVLTWHRGGTLWLPTREFDALSHTAEHLGTPYVDALRIQARRQMEGVS